MRLPARAWRTLYNVADALRPAPEGSAVVDIAPAIEAVLADGAQERALRRTLRLLELETRLLHAPLRGFCWLPRDERRAALARLENSPLAARRRAFTELARLVDAGLAAQSLPGA